MSYIGKTPTVGNFQVCDAISVVNGQAAYTMQVDSVNVVPESANHMLVSLNGILQKPGSSFTVSGSTITFASNLSTGDVIDFITLLGNVLDLGTPSDATVTNAKTNFTSTSSAAGLQIKGDGTTDGTLQLNCSQNSHGIKLQSPAHSAAQSYTLKFPTGNVTADTFLKVDSVSGSGATGVGQLSFGAVSSDYVKIARTDITSSTASVTFQNGSGGVVIDSTYKNYIVAIQNCQPVTQGDTPRVRVGVAGTIRTSGYFVEAFRSYYSGGTSRGSRTDSIFSPSGGVEHSVHGEALCEIVLNNLPDANFKSAAIGMYALMDGDASATNQVNQGTSGGIYGTAEANDTINIYFGAGNILKGTFTLYGRK